MTLQQKLNEAKLRTQFWAKGENIIWPDCLEWTIPKLSIQEIYEGLARIINCGYCKKEFKVSWSRNAKFCSRKCYWKSMIKLWKKDEEELKEK